MTTTAQAALKQLFPQLTAAFGEVTHIEGSDRTPDYQSTTAPLNAIERLKQDPNAYVDARASGASLETTTVAQSQGSAEQQVQSQALRNAARSGQPFVEH
ncbi:hypothetical protein D3C76_1379700 [compost metagenome]